MERWAPSFVAEIRQKLRRNIRCIACVLGNRISVAIIGLSVFALFIIYFGSTGHTLDTGKCYPQHTPYWMIFIGFITTTVIQLISYTSGQGKLSLLKSVSCCKRQQTSTSEIQEFPKVIQLSCAYPWKWESLSHSAKSASIYNRYILDPANGEPRYLSKTRASESRKHYQLQYIKKHSFKGWALFVDEEKNFKFVAAQTKMNGLNDQQNALKVELLQQSDRDIDAMDEKHSILQSLTAGQIQTFILYSKQTRSTVYVDFWNVSNLTKTNFDFISGDKIPKHASICEILCCGDRTDNHHNLRFNINNHWINFTCFEKYIHSIWKTESLNINGKYILMTYKRFTTPNAIEDKFVFRHSQNQSLFLVWKDKWKKRTNLFPIRTKLKSRLITIRYGHLLHGYTLAKIERVDVGKMKVSQSFYDDNINVYANIRPVKPWKNTLGDIMTIIQIMVIGWQYYHDLKFLLNFADLFGPFQLKYYECFGYILTNSASMKEYIVFLLCCQILGRTFLFRKYNVVGYVFLTIMVIHFGLLIPFIFTHFVEFFVAYFWIYAAVVIVVYLYYVTMKFAENHQCCRPKIRWISYIFLLMIISFGYILLILFPVVTVNRVFAGNGYWGSLLSVFNDRHTKDFIESETNEITTEYFRIQKIIWFL